ncbi:PepSY-associated TM helix domain-containing protein [Methylobacterium radiodurans]|uniref:Peptidase n=1 Tax=Methylobacterium radiodurans TaxID=2202828 RepID=A0A2U8VLH0_9HYPH|nr:PepSY-associated TM helix domain-containing protein [Methylobacterium radiodurans]AWN34499.1 peptidase [Methylobacterium radiodurans]
MLRTILFRTHWALGLTAGLVLALMGVTGALMSYEEAIVEALNARTAAVEAGDRARLGPEALVARIEAQVPGQRVTALSIPGDPGRAVRVRFAGTGPGEHPASHYVDPYDGADRGAVAGEEAFDTIRSLHRWLLIPGGGRGWGRTVTGLCAVALLVFLATGLYLRWPKLHRWRIWLRPALARPGRPRWWSLHAVVGTWVIPVYAVIALTGLWWSYDAYRAGATYLLTGSWPEARPQRQAGAGRRDGGRGERRPAALDAAWQTFTTGEGANAALAVLSMPGERGEPNIRIRYLARPGDGPSSRTDLTYDAASGSFLAAVRPGDKTLGRQIADNMLEVHRGRFFGPVFTLIFGLASLAMPLFAATGITLYLLRRRTARTRRAAPAVGRAARA